MTDERAERPLSHLSRYSAVYNKPWSRFDEFRAAKPEPWPDWCFCPLAGAQAIIMSAGTPAHLAAIDTGALGAMAAWRVTQGVYRFHTAVERELWEQPVSGDLPVEVFRGLPEWAPYIALSEPREFGEGVLHGFFVYLEWDVNDHRTELRFTMDVELNERSVLLSNQIHLLPGTLEQAIDRARQLGRHLADRAGIEARHHQGWDDIVQPMVSLTLYLCAKNAELRSGDLSEPRPFPVPKKTKRGLRLFPPAAPTVWDVAYRSGAALEQLERVSADSDGSGSSPRAHVRRAHWHTYWTGSGEAKTPVLKWLAPILVGQGDITATERDV